MIKWIMLLILIVVLSIACKWLYQRYFTKDIKIKDINSRDDKPAINVKHKKFDNKKVLGKALYDKKLKNELNITSVKLAFKSNKKGRNL